LKIHTLTLAQVPTKYLTELWTVEPT
jgi:hypothetical protein